MHFPHNRGSICREINRFPNSIRFIPEHFSKLLKIQQLLKMTWGIVGCQNLVIRTNFHVSRFIQINLFFYQMFLQPCLNFPPLSFSLRSWRRCRTIGPGAACSSSPVWGWSSSLCLWCVCTQWARPCCPTRPGRVSSPSSWESPMATLGPCRWSRRLGKYRLSRGSWQVSRRVGCPFGLHLVRENQRFLSVSLVMHVILHCSEVVLIKNLQDQIKENTELVFRPVNSLWVFHIFRSVTVKQSK